MIKVQYVADHHIQAGWIYYPSKCDACGKSIEGDKTSVVVSFAHDSVWNDIVLCSECRQELYKKIYKGGKHELL